MTDFVMRHKNTYSDIYALKSIKKYANFLKQEVTLNMLVPCDDKGKPFGKYIELGKGLLQKHEEAKKKLYFDINIDLESANFHISQKRTIEYFTAFDIQISDYAIQKFSLDT